MDLQRLSGRPNVTVPTDAEIWDLTSEEAGTAIETLSAATARSILAELYDQPRTASELADATDNSLQNVNYHLQNLLGANLIEIADTRYSRKGTEMKIYAPSTNAVLLLSQESTARRIKQLLSRLIAGIGALAIGALVFRSIVVGGLVNVPGVVVDPGSDDVFTEDTADPATAEHDDVGPNGLVEIANPLDHLPFLLDPGVVFFTGGLLVLGAVLGVRWWQSRP